MFVYENYYSPHLKHFHRNNMQVRYTNLNIPNKKKSINILHRKTETVLRKFNRLLVRPYLEGGCYNIGSKYG